MADRSSGIALSVVATAAAMAMLYFLRDVLIPLVLAFVLAVLVDTLVRFVARRLPGAPNWLVRAIAGLAAGLGAMAVAFILAQGASRIVSAAPALIAQIDRMLEASGHSFGLREPLHLATLTGQVRIAEVARVVAESMGGFLSGFLLMITYFIFILAGRRGVPRKIANISGGGGRAAAIEAVIARISGDIETYLWVQTVTGAMIAAAAALVMFAVGLDNVLFWTVLLFLLCYIPVIGATVGSILPALFALLQLQSWWQAAAVFVGIQVGVTIVGNFIYPRLQAESQNFDPVASMLALAFWGLLWGIAGAFLAAPLTLMVMMICAHFPRTRWLAILLSNDGEPYPDVKPDAALRAPAASEK